jgi:large subunit ribosomal protein L30
MAAGIKVKLVGSMSGHEESHRATLRGLGLTRVGKQRVVQDSPETRGMIAKVGYLLEVTETKEEFKPFGRRQSIKAARAASAARGGK